MRRLRLRGLRDRLSGDGGFALIEVMVSAVVLLVIGTATLSLIDGSSKASSTNRQRSEAVGLAQLDQDSMRLMSLAKLTGRNVTTTQVVGNTTFTIQSRGDWIRDASGVVVCNADGSRVEYVKTTSMVSWPGHNPVVLESYVSPGIEAVAAGAVLVKLHTDPGAPTAGIPVKLGTGATATTDSGGCAIFSNVAAGATTVGFDGSQGTYVDRNGNATITSTSLSFSVGSAQTNQIDALFDRAGAIPVTWVNELNQTVANPDGDAMAVNAGITTPASGTRSLTVNAAGKLTGLFPFVAAYSVYAGNCTANNPTSYLASATTPSVVVPAGADATGTNVPMASLAIYVTNDGTATGTLTSGATITVKPANNTQMRGCTDGNFTAGGNGALTSNGTVPTVANLPYGQYQVCASKGGRSSSVGTVNVTPSGSTTYPQAQAAGATYTQTNRNAATVAMPVLNQSATCPTS